MLPILNFPGGPESARVHPLVSADAQAHHDGLSRGELLLLSCDACGRRRLLAAPLCPWCSHDRATWQPASGAGRIHSWARYRRNYLPEFETVMPYVVLAVQLEEGPVVFGRLVASDAEPAMGKQVRAVVEKWSDGFCGLGFAFAGDAQ